MFHGEHFNSWSLSLLEVARGFKERSSEDWNILCVCVGGNLAELKDCSGNLRYDKHFLET